MNVRLNSSYNQHNIDLVLKSPENKVSQSEKVILRNRDTNESVVDL